MPYVSRQHDGLKTSVRNHPTPLCQNNGDLNYMAAKAQKFTYFSFLATWQIVSTISSRKPQAIKQ